MICPRGSEREGYSPVFYKSLNTSAARKFYQKYLSLSSLEDFGVNNVVSDVVELDTRDSISVVSGAHVDTDHVVTFPGHQAAHTGHGAARSIERCRAF